MWDQLVNEPSVLSGVIEDLTLPAGQRIQASGATMIVPRNWCERWTWIGRPAGIHHAPYLSCLRDGSFQPMTDREIGIENARAS